MPPAVFLFLLGVTFAFLMDSQERKGFTAPARWGTAVKRAGYLFAAAFAFRLQLWFFSIDKSPWTDLFRVDILNSMGLALLVLSAMAVFRTVERVRLCAILGVAIAAASPLISSLDWSGAPEIVRNYVIPDHNFFGFFPWAAFVAFGMSMGSILRLLEPEEVAPAMQWVGWGGLALAFGAYTISSMSLSIYPNSDFWLNSPALIFIKLGAVMILLAFAWVWNLRRSGNDWSWVRQFGLTSLLVYWVHVELIYGRWFGALKEQLTVGQTVLASVLTILLMLGISMLRTNWTSVRGYFTGGESALARRVSGD
jgi:peptidoglycan/LPS O-acetylase OafA/YrhL